MFRYPPVRRILDATRLLRPRTITGISARADQANREVDRLRGHVKDLDLRIEQLASELAVAAATMKTQDRRIAMLTALHASDLQHAGDVASCDADLDRDEVVTHIKRRIGAGVIHHEPFPHMVIDNVLPSALYRHLIASLPAPAFFDERPAHRAQFMRLPFDVAPKYSRRVWNFVNDLLEDALPDVLLQTFGSAIDEYIEPAVDGQSLPRLQLKVMDRRLLLRRPGYDIRPHRDPRWGFLTMLVYLARKGESEAYGTQLYAATGEGEPSTTGEVFYADERCCTLAKDVPAKANSALVFLNSHGAHGASIPADAPADTERYVLQLRVGPDPASARTLVAHMRETAREAWAVYRGKAVAS